MNQLEKRIIDISYKKGLSHIGSCLTAVGIIDDIFKQKKPDEKFVLSCGHAGLALYVVLESIDFKPNIFTEYGIEQFEHNAEELFDRCGVHPDRMLAPEAIDCSTGSLGLGITIALGMAMADISKKVYCLISDGEAMEGSVYEAINVKKKHNVNNLIVYMNYNGLGAYDKISKNLLPYLPGVIVIDNSDHWFIREYGQESHYKILKEHEKDIF